MEIIGNRKFVEIAGDRTHDLPPLLVGDAGLSARRLEKVLSMATELVDWRRFEKMSVRTTGEPTFWY